jgi:hypothetical protein
MVLLQRSFNVVDLIFMPGTCLDGQGWVNHVRVGAYASVTWCAMLYIVMAFNLGKGFSIRKIWLSHSMRWGYGRCPAMGFNGPSLSHILPITGIYCAKEMCSQVAQN